MSDKFESALAVLIILALFAMVFHAFARAIDIDRPSAEEIRQRAAIMAAPVYTP